MQRLLRCLTWTQTYYFGSTTTSTQCQRGGSCSSVLSSRRYCSTTPLEQLVINGARWDDSNYYHRLGFHEEVRDAQRIKEHYRILAKHYHPDNPSAPPDATVAFQSIKEAYEHLLASSKEGSTNDNNSFGGVRFSDHERRKQQMRFLGEGVGLFMVMTFLFIYLVSRHNKERLHARYLWHMLFIFFVIQLFPRLLAAAILYASHTNYLVSLTEAREQAEASVFVERRSGNLLVRLEGIPEAVVKNVIMQITVTPASSEEKRRDMSDVTSAVEKKTSVASMSTTLTFDSGVTSVSVPAHPECGATYRIKAVDEKRGFVIVDRKLCL